MSDATLAFDSTPVVTSELAAIPVIAGFTDLKLVGRGGMGKVYRARHEVLGRIVALKMLVQEPDDRLLARFRDEARAVARLQHPQIAALYESGVADGRPYLVQEFVEGGSLAEALGGKPQESDWAVRLLEAIARAVAFSHGQGVLHRDLKPANILLTRDGTPKVTDFGLAKLLTTADGADPSPSDLTQTGEILGTPAYMAPEQASGVVTTIGPGVDVYALGAMLYEVLTGRPPFQAPDPIQTVMMVLSMDPVAPRTLQPKIPRDLETICLKCLEKTPRKRYLSAAAVADDLARFRVGDPIVARPVGTVERAWKWSRRRPWQVAALGLAGTGVISLAVGLFWVAKKNRQIQTANVGLAQSNATLRATNVRLDQSKAQTEGILGYALATLDQYHFGLSDKLKEVPGGELLRVEVLDQASRTLDELDKLAPERREVWEYLMDGYSRLAIAQGQAGRLDRAVESYARCRDLTARLLRDGPDDIRLRANRAIVGFNLATVLDRLGRPNDSAPLLAEGAETAANLMIAAPDETSVLKLNVMASLRLAQTSMVSGDFRAVETAFARLADLYRRLARVDSTNSGHAVAAVEWDIRRVDLASERNDLPAAEALLESARRALQPMAPLDSILVRRVRAELHKAEATVHAARGRPEDAEAAYRQAIAIHGSLATDFPAGSTDRRSIVNAWQALGGIWRLANRPDHALTCLREARAGAVALVASFPEDIQMIALRDDVEQAIRVLIPQPAASPP